MYNQYVNRGHERTIFINPILTLYLNYMLQQYCTGGLIIIRTNY